MGEAEIKEKELEEGEMEEGEACALLVRYESNFDPDVDLSHIGDKVELLLGHFQKDFEGRVLKENLGHRYGAYGSFLPSYERSPYDISHARTSQIHQNNNIAIDPYCFWAKDAALGSSARIGGNYTSVAPLPVTRAPTMNNNSSKRDVYLSSFPGTGGFAAKLVTLGRSNNPFEQESLESLMKTNYVGVLPKKYGASSNEVVLDSSSSSSENIPAQSKGLSPETREAPDASPMHILENVTFSPAPGEYLLSPLFDNFLCLPETQEGNKFLSDESPMSIPENVTSFPVPGECLPSPLPGSLLSLTGTLQEKNWESMAFGNASKVGKRNSKDCSADKIHGDRKASSGRDDQSNRRKDGRKKAEERPGMNGCDVSEVEAIKTLYDLYQLHTSDQHNNLDCHTNAPASGSAGTDDEHLAQSHQDHSLATLPNVGKKNEYGSEDVKHSKSNVKRLANQDRSRVSKKTKALNSYYANEDYDAENGGVTRKLGSGLSNGLLSEKAQKCSGYSSSKDSKSLDLFDARSPVKKNSSCESAANEVLKEGNDFKDKADSLKNFVPKLQSAGLYFQAALKFLQGAFLLEPCSNEIAKHREITDSMIMYKEAAILCEYAANEYERYDEMAVAALAYKCMEAAYMRVVYAKSARVNQDRHELQMGLLNICLGESPSSSTSDVDSMHNQGMLDKGVDCRMAGYHTIVAGNLPKLERVLNFVQDANMAMTASKNSEKALAVAAANEGRKDSKYAEGISLVRRAINLTPHYVDSLIYLVRLANEAMSH